MPIKIVELYQYGIRMGTKPDELEQARQLNFIRSAVARATKALSIRMR